MHARVGRADPRGLAHPRLGQQGLRTQKQLRGLMSPAVGLGSAWLAGRCCAMRCKRWAGCGAVFETAVWVKPTRGAALWPLLKNTLHYGAGRHEGCWRIGNT